MTTKGTNHCDLGLAELQSLSPRVILQQSHDLSLLVDHGQFGGCLERVDVELIFRGVAALLGSLADLAGGVNSQTNDPLAGKKWRWDTCRCSRGPLHLGYRG